MALNKKAEFGGKDQELADFAKALSHPARVAILRTLARKGSCICGEIVEVLPLSQSTVSQHLKALKEAGVIQGEIEGRTSCYCLDWEKLSRAWNHFGDIFKELERNHGKSCC